jgi:hypothetical protein
VAINYVGGNVTGDGNTFTATRGDATTDLTVEVASSAVAPEADWAPPALLAGFPDHSRARPRIVLQLPNLGLCNLRQVWRCSADGCRFKRHGMLALVTCPLDRVHVDPSQDTSSLVMGHLIYRHTSRSFIRGSGVGDDCRLAFLLAGFSSCFSSRLRSTRGGPATSQVRIPPSARMAK